MPRARFKIHHETGAAIALAYSLASYDEYSWLGMMTDFPVSIHDLSKAYSVCFIPDYNSMA